MPLSRQNLIQATQAFCDAFANKADVSTILTYFSKTTTITVFEHGEPVLVPFLGRVFKGFEGVKNYFEIIGTLLTYRDLKFSELVVDTEARKVSVKGRGMFIWLETAQSWDETFTYVLDFDGEAKVVRYQVWADTGAAYLASIGKLNDVRKENGC